MGLWDKTKTAVKNVDNRMGQSVDSAKYDSKISELEEKANKYEDNLYAKFSKMEATMARLQSKSNAMAGYLGGGR